MSNQAQNQDNSYSLILIIVAICTVLSLITAGADEFRSLTAIAALMLLTPFSWSAQNFEWQLGLPLAGKYLFEPALYWCSLLPLFSMPKIETHQWINLQLCAGRGATVLFCIPLLVAMFYLRQRRLDLQYRCRHNFDSLIDAQSYAWPLVGIVKTFECLSERINPAKSIFESLASNSCPNIANSQLLQSVVPPLQPPAMEIALRPEWWLVSQRLANCRVEEGQQLGQKELGVEIHSGLSVEAISEVMESQLGPQWQGFELIRPALRGLAAVFALGYGERSVESEKLLNKLSQQAEISVHSRYDLDELIRRNNKLSQQINSILAESHGKRLQKIADRHAWVRTAFISMLLVARVRIGVLASSSFVWLKREDRTLWLALNAAGNNTSAAESAGVVAHHLAELQSRQPLQIPTVSFASQSITQNYLNLDDKQRKVQKILRAARKPVGAKLQDAADNHLFEDTELC